MPEVFAAADIGSNTVHLLVAGLDSVGLKRLINESEWLSLGQVVSHEGGIPSDLIDRLIATLGTFRAHAKSQGAQGLYVFATEAVRKASNYRDVIKRLQKATGLTIDVISPNKEAELGLKGALLDCPQEDKFLLVETGGGSVQLALCEGPDILAETSLPIGTGVILDKANLRHPAPASSLNAATKMVNEPLKKLIGFEGARTMVASGGVARGLWRALHPDGERSLHIVEVEYLAWSTQHLNQTTISKRYGVKPKRAVTLLPGALIYQAIMAHFGMHEMTVSQYGVREGAILEMSQGRIVPCPV